MVNIYSGLVIISSISSSALLYKETNRSATSPFRKLSSSELLLPPSWCGNKFNILITVSYFVRKNLDIPEKENYVAIYFSHNSIDPLVIHHQLIQTGFWTGFILHFQVAGTLSLLVNWMQRCFTTHCIVLYADIQLFVSYRYFPINPVFSKCH